MLAKAVAGEAGVPFFSISGSEFVEMFVGVGAARVRDLFEQARKAAPCIIFIDELDALGKARGGSTYGGHDEKEQRLNQLLTELDGFDSREGIVLLGATNRPEVLDPALLRAGRFDRQVVLDRPDRKGRAAILTVHIKKIKVATDVNLDEIAAITPGFTGADLANLMNEAAIVATRRGATEVAMPDFTAAVERIVAGAERKGRLLHPREREVVAYHEMGHALAAVSLPDTDPVHKVSIIPRSIGALGYTMQRPTDDRFLITMHELKDRMVVLLAGRAAEQIVFGIQWLFAIAKNRRVALAFGAEGNFRNSGKPGKGGVSHSKFARRNDQCTFSRIAADLPAAITFSEHRIIGESCRAENLFQSVANVGTLCDRATCDCEFTLRCIPTALDFHQPVGNQYLAHRHFVPGQGSGLIGADDRGSAQCFYCRQLTDDGVRRCHAPHPQTSPTFTTAGKASGIAATAKATANRKRPEIVSRSLSGLYNKPVPNTTAQIASIMILKRFPVRSSSC